MILCCIRGRPDNEWRETLELCDKYREQGVLAIDVAGDEGSCVDPDPWKGTLLTLHASN